MKVINIRAGNATLTANASNQDSIEYALDELYTLLLNWEDTNGEIAVISMTDMSEEDFANLSEFDGF